LLRCVHEVQKDSLAPIQCILRCNGTGVEQRWGWRERFYMQLFSVRSALGQDLATATTLA